MLILVVFDQGVAEVVVEVAVDAVPMTGAPEGRQVCLPVYVRCQGGA